MDFDLKYSSQCFDQCHEWTNSTFEYLEQKSKGAVWFRLAGLPAAVVLTGILGLGVISHLAENLLKGSLNLMGGALGFSACNIKTGASQLFLEVPKIILLSPLFLIGGAVLLVSMPIGILLEPEKYIQMLNNSAKNFTASTA